MVIGMVSGTIRQTIWKTIWTINDRYLTVSLTSHAFAHPGAGFRGGAIPGGLFSHCLPQPNNLSNL